MIAIEIRLFNDIIGLAGSDGYIWNSLSSTKTHTHTAYEYSMSRKCNKQKQIKKNNWSQASAQVILIPIYKIITTIISQLVYLSIVW